MSKPDPRSRKKPKPGARPARPGAAPTPQRRALGLLRALDEGRGYTSELLRPDDPPLVRELCLGVARRRLTLDTLHDAYGRRRIDELDPPVRDAVRLGLYQLVFLDGVPAHTAVDQTVGAVPLASHRSYLNGLLRGFLRGSRRVTPDLDRGGARPICRFERPGRAVFFFSREVFADPEADLALYLAQQHSHPRMLVARWLERLGEAATIERLQAGNLAPALVVRPCLARIDAEGLVERLRREELVAGLVEREGGLPSVQIAAPPRAFFASAAWKKGLCSVQDPRQRDAVELLAPRAGEVVWDVCAAPGGKTTQLAEQLEDGRRLVASDVSASRLARVGENLARLDLEPRAELHVHDLLAAEAPSFAPDAGFDAILLDAPCSNSAVFDRRPEARWRFDDDTLGELVELQTRLIEAARRQLAPGGRLVYSVCSFEPEEGAGHGLTATRSPFVFVEHNPS